MGGHAEASKCAGVSAAELGVGPELNWDAPGSFAAFSTSPVGHFVKLGSSGDPALSREGAEVASAHWPLGCHVLTTAEAC